MDDFVLPGRTHSRCPRFDAHVLGGSGLLHALGLTEVVNDWDLTTAAPKEAVVKSLRAIHVIEEKSVSATFCSDYVLVLPNEDIEIIGGYAIRVGDGVCHLPSISGGIWEGVPTASPEVWAVAYYLMGRQQKAELLSGYLQRVGVSSRVIDILLKEPLPSDLRDRLEVMMARG